MLKQLDWHGSDQVDTGLGTSSQLAGVPVPAVALAEAVAPDQKQHWLGNSRARSRLETHRSLSNFESTTTFPPVSRSAMQFHSMAFRHQKNAVDKSRKYISFFKTVTNEGFEHHKK